MFMVLALVFVKWSPGRREREKDETRSERDTKNIRHQNANFTDFPFHCNLFTDLGSDLSYEWGHC